MELLHSPSYSTGKGPQHAAVIVSFYFFDHTPFCILSILPNTVECPLCASWWAWRRASGGLAGKNRNNSRRLTAAGGLGEISAFQPHSGGC
jgi:hypothetical protein